MRRKIQNQIQSKHFNNLTSFRNAVIYLNFTGSMTSFHTHRSTSLYAVQLLPSSTVSLLSAQANTDRLPFPFTTFSLPLSSVLSLSPLSPSLQTLSVVLASSSFGSPCLEINHIHRTPELAMGAGWDQGPRWTNSNSI